MKIVKRIMLYINGISAGVCTGFLIHNPYHLYAMSILVVSVLLLVIDLNDNKS